MKLFKASFTTIILRYYLMVFIVVSAYVVNMEFLAILALPIFLSAIMGVKIDKWPIKKYERGISISKKQNIPNTTVVQFQ